MGYEVCLGFLLMMQGHFLCRFALFKHLFFAINDVDALALLGGGASL